MGDLSMPARTVGILAEATDSAGLLKEGLATQAKLYSILEDSFRTMFPRGNAEALRMKNAAKQFLVEEGRLLDGAHANRVVTTTLREMLKLNNPKANSFSLVDLIQEKGFAKKEVVIKKMLGLEAKMNDINKRKWAVENGIPIKPDTKIPAMTADELRTIAAKSGAYGAAEGALWAEDDKVVQESMLGLGFGLALPFFGQALGKALAKLDTEVLDKIRKTDAWQSTVSPFFRRGIISLEKDIRKSGPVGEKVADLIENYRYEQGRMKGEYFSNLISKDLDVLTKGRNEDLALRRKLWKEAIEGTGDSDLYKNPSYWRAKFIDSGISPQDAERLLNISLESKLTLADIGLQAKAMKFIVKSDDGSIKMFNPREGYFPQVINDRAMRSEKQLTKMAYAMVKNKKVASTEEAMSKLKELRAYRKEHRSSFLEHEREFDLPDEALVDPFDAFVIYLDDSLERLANVKILGFGKANIGAVKARSGESFNINEPVSIQEGLPSKLSALVNELESKVMAKGSKFTQDELVKLDEARYIKQLLERGFEGVDMKRYPEGGFLSGLRQFQNFKLSLAAIPNAFQGINELITYGTRSQAKALAESFSKEGVEWGRLTGATYDSFRRTLPQIAEQGHEGILSKPLRFMFKWTGFNATEQMNRSTAAIIGRKALQEMTERYSKTKVLTGTDMAILNRLKVSPKLLELKSAGKLSDDSWDMALKLAGYQEAKAGQFLTEVWDMPYHWSNPYAKVAMQFKTYIYKQSELIKTAVWDEALRGNTLPLQRMIFWGSLLGEVSADLKEFARTGDISRVKDKTMAERQLENMAAVGAFGIFWDTIQSSARSPQGIAAMVAGPTVGDVGQLGYDATRAAGGDFDNLGLSAVQRIPLVGPMLKSKLKE